MNYPDSVRFLYALGNEIKTAKFGLERIRALLAALGNPQDRLDIVHVAGTNGKGSTCAMLEAALRHAGRRTGLYTSPHLSEPTERIRINGEPIDAARFAEAFDQVHHCSEALLEQGAIDLHPTYFETVTAMAFLVFAAERADAVVLEVGLGGRLDATNVVNPHLCVITPIDFDHEAFLGTSIESIAAEKAGILKRGVPVVFAPQRSEAAAVLRERSTELDIAATWVNASQITALDLNPSGCRYRLTGATELHIECPLAGEHQAVNSATAAIALLRLGLTPAQIERGIATATWPGRLERFGANPEIILDGAHNPAGARALAEYLHRFYADGDVTLIFGAMRDKAVDEIAGALFPLATRLILTAPQQSRAMSPEALREATGHPDVSTAPDVEAALAAARAGNPGVIFITGSLFLVAEARDLLLRRVY